MLSGYREGGSPVYGSSFVTACDNVLLGEPKVKEILEGYAPREEKEKNQSETAPKTVTSKESYAALEELIMTYYPMPLSVDRIANVGFANVTMLRRG